MSSPASRPEPASAFPDDPRLAEVAQALNGTRSAALLCDPQWDLVWVSTEMRAVLGAATDEELGVGKHVLEAYLSDQWAQTITTDTQYRLFMEHFPRLIKDTPGGRARLQGIFDEAIARWAGASGSEFDVPDVFAQMEEREPETVWTDRIEFLQEDLPPLEIAEVGVRLRDPDGSLIGTAVLYGSALPAHVLSLVARGNEEMFERMINLVRPGKRQAAILFADLQASSILSRRLPSSAYFGLIQALTTAMDDVVVEERGIVGKHAGDGVTAFFLADDLGSTSRAVQAAIRSARGITEACSTAVKELGDETGLITVEDCYINVGLHWGAALYMGQLVTGGRLEVTALGDEVNECARIQESASNGQTLASKGLMEQLQRNDAAALGLDPDASVYRMVSELPDVTAKAARDAGTIPVTAL